MNAENPPPGRCPAAPSLSASGATARPPPPPASDGIINKTLFKCRKCKLLFWTTGEAASHERGCREPQWFNCAVCQVLRFRSREERTVHERTCPGARPLRIADLPLADRVGNAAGRGGGAGVGAGGSIKGGAGAGGGARTAAAGGVADRAEKASGAAAGGNPAGGPPKPKQQDATKRIGAIIETYRDQIRRGSISTSSAARKPGPAAASTSSASAPRSAGGGAADGSDSDVEIIGTTIPPSPKPASGKGVDVPAKKSQDKAKPSPKDAKKEPMEWTTVWTCDVCHRAQFDSFEAAVAHEKQCQAAAKKEASRPSQDPSPAVKKVSGTSAKVKAAAALASSPKPNVKVAPSPSPPKKPSPSPRKLPLNRPLTLLSPVLKDSVDSASFSQISKYHRLILKSLKLLHLPPSLSGGGTVSFQCQFCSHAFPPSDNPKRQRHWTLKTIAETLPSVVLTHHLSGACESVPADVAAQLPTAKSSGKMPFDEFLSGFFSENGIVERFDGRGVVVLPDEEFRNMPGAFKSKRGKPLSGGSGKKKRGRPVKNAAASKRQKPVDPDAPLRSKHREIRYGDMGCRTHIEEGGTRFCVGPLDGLPFLSSFSAQSEALKGLHSSERFLLQQVELFTISPKLAEAEKMNVPPESVGMRCRNCIADKNGCCFMKLSSVDNLSRDVLLMAKEHVGSCKFMKAKDVKVIQDLITGGKDRGSLTKYCEWMAKSYSMEDSKGGGGVVWGDSPKVPAGGYCSPADVKVDLLLGGDVSAPDLEAEGSAPAKDIERNEVVASDAALSATADVAAPSSGERPSPDVSKLTHYHLLVLMEFVIVPSSGPMNSFGDGNDRELPSSRGAPPTAASFKCKHCEQIIATPTSVEHMTASLLPQLPSHAQCCPCIPRAKKEELARWGGMLKITEEPRSKQRLGVAGVDRYVAYAGELCTKVYGMTDIRDPETGASYVGFSNMEELKAKYGKKDGNSSSNGDDANEVGFSLPMIEKLF